MPRDGKEKATKGVANVSRRTWDKDEYREKAKEREEAEDQLEGEEETAQDIKRRKRLERDPLHQGLIVARANLQQRDYQLDLTSRLGKSQIITTNMPLNQQAGYYCQLCDCILRDSKSYLDHINGKWHNRALGMSMRVEQSSVTDVKARLAAHKKKKEAGTSEDYVADGFDRRVLEAEEREERERDEKRRAKKEERRRRRDREEKDDDAAEAAQKEREEASALMDPSLADMHAMMGFGGFGSSKK